MTRRNELADFLQHWVVEWSPRQKTFHLHTVEEMLKWNNQAFDREKQPDYFPIGIYTTREDAVKASNDSEGIVNRRSCEA